MNVDQEAMKLRIEGLERTLIHLRRLYLNPELRKVIDLTLVGRYSDAVNYGKTHLLRDGGKEYMGEGIADPEDTTPELAVDVTVEEMTLDEIGEAYEEIHRTVDGMT